MPFGGPQPKLIFPRFAAPEVPPTKKHILEQPP